MKKISLILISCLVTFATLFSPVTQAEENKNSENKVLNKDDVERVDLNQVQNLDATLKNTI
ncbi:hypothetical protein [Staphylococcus simulans]|uniref:hypothetical protein n=1 Tax=Staphylococcus simulans TaxID=1286 RepID=UPI003CEA2430